MFHPTPEEFGSSRFFIAAAALAVGLLTGFAGGYVTSQRSEGAVAVDPSPTSAHGQPLALSTAEEPAQTYTETPVSEVPAEVHAPLAVTPDVDAPAVAKAEVTASRPAGVVRAAPQAARSRRVRSSGTGAMFVFSRPSGAHVFLDERLVGSTPLSLDEVSAGRHGVRIALPEHRAWATSVTVTPGTSLRVAASLER